MPIDPRRIEVMDDQVAEIMRRKTPADALAMLDEMWEFGWSIVEAGVRRDYPGWDDNQVRRETAQRMSGETF